jgi:S-adenosylmethionine hydrolase
MGDITAVHETVNPAYMRLPVSAIFHGRDIFTPAAAHAAMGVPITEFGPALDPDSLVQAAYDEAVVDGTTIKARVIQINRFGTAHLNILHEQWNTSDLAQARQVRIESGKLPPLTLPFGRTFSDVPKDHCLVLTDDFGRIAMARNLGSFIETYPLAIGDTVTLLRG